MIDLTPERIQALIDNASAERLAIQSEAAQRMTFLDGVIAGLQRLLVEEQEEDETTIPG